MEERLPNYISGPKFAEFLLSRGVENKELPQKNSSQIGHWKGGLNISVWKADMVLTHLGMNLRELPDDAWLPVDYSPSNQRVNRARATGQTPNKQRARVHRHCRSAA